MYKENKRIFKREWIVFMAAVLTGVLMSGGFITWEASAEEETESYASAENVLEIDPVYVGDSITIEEEPVVEFEGTITDASPTCQFSYTAPRDGRYFFSVRDLKQNCDVSFHIYDSLGNKICSGYDKMISLEESESYTIQVEQWKGNTDFTVQIQAQKPSTDVTGITEINDQVTFSEQKNVYFYTAPLNGTYCLSLSNATANVKFEFMIWDQYDTNIIDTTLTSATVDFEAGETYQIQIRQLYWSGIGKYTLCIQEQKPVVDITGYTYIYDSLEYNKQKNHYSFVAPVSGEYKISLIDAKGIYVYAYSVYDPNNNIIDSDYYQKVDTGTSVSLSEGDTYLIEIKPYETTPELGSYVLKIDYPFSAQEYLENAGAGVETAISDEQNSVVMEEKSGESNETEEENSEVSNDDLILQRLEDLESELNEVKDENENLKNILDENEIEYD